MPNKRTENKACFFNSDVTTAISICLSKMSERGVGGGREREGEKESSKNE